MIDRSLIIVIIKLLVVAGVLDPGDVYTDAEIMSIAKKYTDANLE
jgi:hypothetical protein